MRTFLAAVILLCVFAGWYLLQGPAFFMPSRDDPGFGILLEGFSSQLLGAGLLTVAALGLMVVRQAGYGKGRIATRVWQTGFFSLTVIALGLIIGAFLSGTPGTDPQIRDLHHREPAALQDGVPENAENTMLSG